MITHVCFFGASVSEQSKHHATQETTGYVTYLSELLNAKYNIATSRITSGSNSIDDAGVTYVHRVINQNPNVCVLDWATPECTDCNQHSIEFIYSELLENKIIPLTVIFPRKDRDQSSTPLSLKLHKFCEAYCLPFIDLSKIIDKSELSILLRDLVHTNSEGAKKYALLLVDPIRKATVPETTFDRLALLQKHYFVTKVISKEKPPNSTKRLFLSIESTAIQGKVKFFLEQRVGPWSTFLDVYSFKNGNYNTLLQTIPLYDSWCWRERQCLKEITSWIELPTPSIKVQQSDKLPIYGSSYEKCDFGIHPKSIRPKGEMFMISTDEHVKAVVTY